MKIDPLALIGANLRDQVENYLDQLPPLMMRVIFWGDLYAFVQVVRFQRVIYIPLYGLSRFI